MKSENKIENILNRYQNIPYPKIPKLYPNKRYAIMLYNNFAGEFGELSAITQYIYENIDLGNNDDISSILLRISVQEMKHLQIIGNILVALGEKPYYQDMNKKAWSSEKIKYCTGDIKEMMKYNIYLEEMAISEYKKAARFTRNIELRRIFERIIMDEINHIEIFKKLGNIR